MMRTRLKWLASFGMGLCCALSMAYAQDFTATAVLSPSGIGLNGNDETGPTVGSSWVFTVPVETTLLTDLDQISIDLSALGTGTTFGVDLANLSTSVGDDILIEQVGGVTIPLAATVIAKDNSSKTITIDFVGINLGIFNGDLRITLGDLQNPPIPYSNKDVAISVRYSSILGGYTESGPASVTLTGGNQQSDADCVPDGFELYYSDGTLALDADGNAGKDSLALHPNVAGDMSLDTDSDLLSIRQEYLAGTDPLVTDPAMTVSNWLTDTDGDGIYDVEEHFAGATVDTDNDTIPDHLDSDSDGDGIPDSVEAGDSLLSTKPVDTDGDCIPDFQDLDSDGDGVIDLVDNCPSDVNANQNDWNNNSKGDVCDDSDSDGIMDAMDNCHIDQNPDQADADNDGAGDLCDLEDYGIFGSGCRIVQSGHQSSAAHQDKSFGLLSILLLMMFVGLLRKFLWSFRS
ncbi:MAG: thrombospondin type 3 repeat-containing protein [Bdellovibrionales bacterium]|nr:thrombospondin type 3 repeat-containing protein [Bdellovibrionales bacterium]